MKLKIRFWNRFDIALLCVAAVAFAGFQFYIRTDSYRARQLVDEYIGCLGAPDKGAKAGLLATLGFAHKPPRDDSMAIIKDMREVAEQAAPLLAERFADDGDFAGHYSCAMGHLGKPARPFLLEFLKSDVRRARWQAAYAFGILREDALPVAPEMLDALHDEEDGILRQSMARSLVRIDRDFAAEEALPVILADLHSDRAVVVMFATVSLGELGPVNAQAEAAITEARKGRFASAINSFGSGTGR